MPTFLPHLVPLLLPSFPLSSVHPHTPSLLNCFLFNCKYKNVQMLPFDGAGHSWRFSDVCRVTQLWLKAFSSGKIKEVWGGLLGRHRDTCSPGAVATTDQCQSRLNTNLYNLTGFETEETAYPENSSLAQIAPDRDYTIPSTGIGIRFLSEIWHNNLVSIWEKHQYWYQKYCSCNYTISGNMKKCCSVTQPQYQKLPAVHLPHKCFPPMSRLTGVICWKRRRLLS